MPKPNKSSASSGTRKKQAAKKADKTGGPPGASSSNNTATKLQRGQKKLSKAEKKAIKNEPKQKVFVPPPKPPAPAIPDPLDSQGLARTLPAELVVVLRRLGKKDGVTRRKGLEELKESWVDPVVAKAKSAKPAGEEDVDIEGEGMEDSLLEALPVWLHNLPSLLLSPGHRGLALSIHTSMLSVASIADSLRNTLALGLFGGEHQCRDVISTWLTACVEESGRRNAGLGAGNADSALGRFEQFVTWETVPDVPESEEEGKEGKLPMVEQLGLLVEYLEMAIMNPHDLHDEVHPAPKSSVTEPSSGAATPKKGTKGSATPNNFPSLASLGPSKIDEESAAEEESQKIERVSRYNLSGVLGLTYVLGKLPGSVDWPERLSNLLASSALWDMLRPTVPKHEVVAAPPVRRALYGLISILISRFPDIFEEKLLPVVGPAVLTSVWRETDGSIWGGTTLSEALTMLLTKFRGVWLLEPVTEAQTTEQAEQDVGSDDDESEDEDDNEDEETDGEAVEEATKAPVAEARYRLGTNAYNQFLVYLQRGCNGCPSEGYPTVLVVLSTLPAEILPLEPQVYNTLFTSLWAAADAKLLSSTPAGSGASPMFQFLSAAIDCIVFLSLRAWRNAKDDERDDFSNITADEVARVWADGILPETGKLTRMDRSMFAEQRLESTREAVALSKGLSRLAQEASALSVKGIEAICKSTLAAYGRPVGDEQDRSRSILIPRFTVLSDALRSNYQADDTMSRELDTLTLQVYGCALESAADPNCRKTTREDYLKLIVRVMKSSAKLLREAQDSRSQTAAVMQSHLSEMLLNLDDNLVGPLCRDYITWLEDPDERLQAWKSISHIVDGLPASRKFDIARALLVTWRNADVALRADGTAWGHIVMEAAEHAGDKQDRDSSAEQLISAVVLHADDIIDKETGDGLLLLITTSISSSINHMLESGGADSVATASLQNQLDAVQALATKRADDFDKSEVYQTAIISISEMTAFADLLNPRPSDDVLRVGNSILEGLGTLTSSEGFRRRAGSHLNDLLDDPSIHLDPAAMVSSLSSRQETRSLVPLAHDLCAGSHKHMSNLLQRSAKAGASMVFDDLLPYHVQEPVQEQGSYDWRGRSVYARRIEAVVALLRSDRSKARESVEVMHHLLLVDRLLRDLVECGGADCGMFAAFTPRSYIDSLSAETNGLVSYAINSLAGNISSQWHVNTMTAITSGGQSSKDSSLLEDLFLRVASSAESDTLSPRILRFLLSRVLSLSGDTRITERWLACGQNMEDKKPVTTRVFLQAVVPHLEKSPRLDRVRNDIASRLTAVPIAKAGSNGLRLLRNLLATSPSSESEDAFLPEQRSIFVMQHLTQWLTSDDDAVDDLPEEVEARICLLFAELAPIVQGRPGAHWTSIFDMIASNLESCSLTDESTYNLAFATLSLLSRVLELSLTNKALAAEWNDMNGHIQLLVRFLCSVDMEDRRKDAVRDRLLSKTCDVIGLLGDKIPDVPDINSLYPLLGYDNVEVQQVAHRICRLSIVKHTAELVIEMETAIDAEDSSKTPVLPARLLDNIAASAEADRIPFGALLSWMLIFDHFRDASASLRSVYSDQLRDRGVVQEALMSRMPDILRQACNGVKPTDSMYFAVDEFHLEAFESLTEQSTIALSTHIFYRALENVPQLVRNWYEACKDRQLAMSFIAIVTRHLSPVLIEHEFAVIRQPGVLRSLENDSLTVRVLSASAEITAKYLIDEQPMEIAIKLPQDYPLRNVEVKEVNRVGVTEGKWRGWMLNVQQLVMSRNGLLLEALKLFKSNVSLHFEGKTECSICYSIISMNDRSLPSRACPTCKNKYHANCLFTWFKSSNSSTCPMCRSLF